MERFIETVGSAWFKTKAVAYPVEITLTSGKQASNIERLKLSRAMESLMIEVVEGGIPAVRCLQPPGGNPMQYMQAPDELVAGTTVECATPDELAQLHGLVSKAETEATVKMTDLTPVYGEISIDRARAFQRALDAAGQAAAAIAQEAKVGLAGLVSAQELRGTDAEPAMGEETPRRVAVQLVARFAIK
ncbi:MAG: hypothetical protein AAFV19_08705 [Pseudomonadota bacterium]